MNIVFLLFSAPTPLSAAEILQAEHIVHESPVYSKNNSYVKLPSNKSSKMKHING